MSETNENSAALVLTAAERKELRALAHHLDPVVMIGDAGVSEAILAETRRALAAHELIKIRVLGDDREFRQSVMRELCDTLGCAPVQMIGKLLVVFLPRNDDDETGIGSSTGVPRKRRGPHRPKKVLGGRVESGPAKSGSSARKAPAGAKGASRSAAKAPAPTDRQTRAQPAGARKALSGKTAGKRTDLHGNDKMPARRGQASKSTSGPSRLQGKPGPRTGGPRTRAKGRG